MPSSIAGTTFSYQPLDLCDAPSRYGAAPHIVDRVDVEVEEGDDQNAQVPPTRLHSTKK